VLAVAMIARVDLLVTANLRHFLTRACEAMKRAP
jgi:Flp pilus assembly pilin Flp